MAPLLDGINTSCWEKFRHITFWMFHCVKLQKPAGQCKSAIFASQLAWPCEVWKSNKNAYFWTANMYCKAWLYCFSRQNYPHWPLYKVKWHWNAFIHQLITWQQLFEGSIGVMRNEDWSDFKRFWTCLLVVRQAAGVELLGFSQPAKPSLNCRKMTPIKIKYEVSGSCMEEKAWLMLEIK